MNGAAGPTDDLHARLRNTFRSSAGPLAARLADHLPAAQRAADGLWRAEPSTWSTDSAVQRKIAQRLGWVAVPHQMEAHLDRLATLQRDVAAAFTDVVLLGMGGSSLAPEVMRTILGVAPKHPRFQMLDSTDPAAVRAASTAPERTLYILASKSGTTIEPNSLAAHFRAVLEASGVPRWSDHFVAITDEGTALAERAQRERFREVFINPSDIGGRYSALSLFGLVPAALMGQDVAALIRWARTMLEVARSEPAENNPAVALGALMAVGARSGRDKLSLLLPDRLETFGLWVEQLVAESTGKQGRGVVPIAGEAAAAAAVFGSDRLFVYNRLLSPAGHTEEPGGASDRELRAANHPLIEIDWPEPAALGAEFMRWEIATAICGALLEINPFDEPNVQQAKDATNVLLEGHRHTGQLPLPRGDREIGGVPASLTGAARTALGAGADPAAFLTLIQPGDYVAVLAYLGPEAELRVPLQELRTAVRGRTGAATMFGYGPRYLHSTGQLHKGGANNGVFLLVTAAPAAADLPIPDAPFSFGTLELAQALGDFNSLDATGRRALHVHLPAPEPARLAAVVRALLEGAGSR